MCIDNLSLGDGVVCLGLELSCTSDDDGVTLGDQQRFERSISSGRSSIPVFIEAHVTAENYQFVEDFGAGTP